MKKEHIVSSNTWLYTKAIVAGAVLDTVCTMFVMMVLMLSLHESGLPEKEVFERMKSTNGLLLSLIIGLGCTVLGSYVAGRIARRSEMYLGMCVAAVGMVFGAFFRESGLPLWYDLAGFSAMLPCGIAGGRFAAAYNSDKKDGASLA